MQLCFPACSIEQLTAGALLAGLLDWRKEIKAPALDARDEHGERNCAFVVGNGKT
jgi:hypothetical protein